MRGVDKSHTLLNNSLDIHSQYVILTFKDNWIEHLTLWLGLSTVGKIGK